MDEGFSHNNSSEKVIFEPSPESVIEEIKEYWNKNIHDVNVARSELGTKEFFDELELYHFEKLDYLPTVVNYGAYSGRKLLEVGCGLGFDLVRFAKGGVFVTGIDISEKTIELARRNFEIHGIDGGLLPMNGEDLQFGNCSFDVVYSHGVLSYTNDAQEMINEVHRVLKPGGEAILMLHHRNSWLFFLTNLLRVTLERDDSPVFKTYSRSEFRQMLYGFSNIEIIADRFPVPTRLHLGVKAIFFNKAFVPVFNVIPKVFVKPFGAHLIAKAIK